MKKYFHLLTSLTLVIILVNFGTVFGMNKKETSVPVLFKSYITQYARRLVKKNPQLKQTAIANSFVTLSQEGGAHYYNIHNNHKNMLPQTASDYKRAINAVLSYFYLLSLPMSKDSSGFVDGSIVVPDYGKKLYHFFVNNYQGLLKSQSKTEEEYIQKTDPPTKHLTSITQEHYGIYLDTKTSVNFSNHVIVIYNSDNQTTFLRLRNEPINGKSWCKFINGTTGYFKILSAQNNSYDNKEHYIPSDMKKQYKKLFPMKEQITIEKMYRNLSSFNNTPYKKLLNEIISKLSNPEIRLGNEIILNDLLIVTGPYYKMISENKPNKATEYYNLLLQPLLKLHTLIFRYKTIENTTITCEDLINQINDIIKNEKYIKEKCPKFLYPIIIDQEKTRICLSNYYTNIVTILKLTPLPSINNTTLISKPIFENNKQQEIIASLTKERDLSLAKILTTTTVNKVSNKK